MANDHTDGLDDPSTGWRISSGVVSASGIWLIRLGLFRVREAFRVRPEWRYASVDCLRNDGRFRIHTTAEIAAKAIV